MPRNKKSITNLKKKIAAARRELNAAWETQGRTDAVVLAAAAKLDALCNEYQRLRRGPVKKAKP